MLSILSRFFNSHCGVFDKVFTELGKVRQDRKDFRVSKTEMEARPVYLKRDVRIKAHFLALQIYP